MADLAMGEATVTMVQSRMDQEMRRILDKQRQTNLQRGPLSLAQRKDRITRAIAILVDHEADLVAALSEDFGHRSAQQSRFTDIMSAVQPLKHARKHVADWMRPERRSVQFPLNLLGARAWVEYQPKGVVGIISPWNFPIQLTFAPLAQVFAAGNSAMIKPSEYTKTTSSLMQRLLAQYFDESEVAVFTGDAEIGQAFASLAFDHLLFTGATSIGRHVMRAAAQNLVPVTLELGGKSPVIVSRSANYAQAAERIVMGKMLNAGQICLAPDYLFVPREVQAAFSDALAAAASRLYPNMLDNPDYTSLINVRHRQRLEGYIHDAQAQGAQVRVVNPANEDFGKQGDGLNKMPLTLLSQVHDQMKVMQDEIFGPVLPILPYGHINEALDYINARPRPLGLYYFGADRNEERLVLDKTTSGGVTLNDVIFHVAQEDLPFGGIGPAGMGAYHGQDGFKTFSHAKAVYRQPKLDIGKLAGTKPPYGKALDRTLAREIKK